MMLVQTSRKLDLEENLSLPQSNKLNVFLDVEPSHRHTNFFDPQKSTAFKIGLYFMGCFANLETFLNLEFETRLQDSLSSVQSDEAESDSSRILIPPSHVLQH